MKKIILSLILFIAFYFSSSAQIYRYIPDVNFRIYLQAIGCPFDASGDSLNISSTIVTSRTNIDCSHDNISNLEGIQYFTTLNNLNCRYNNLDSISNLPTTLVTLNCVGNKLRRLPILPSVLTTLDCSNNPLYTIPSLPLNLVTLTCNDDSLSLLPTLPLSLKNLSCYHNQITILNTLHNGLISLYCGSNLLDTLISLPDSLRDLDVNNNRLNSLPILPSKLNYLTCSSNNITTLPVLPNTLYYLSCGFNRISFLPSLPSSLSELVCDHNTITYLPLLNDTMYYIDISYNYLDSINSLPLYLNYLNCSNNRLQKINYFPPYLETIMCDSNYLRKLPITSIRLLHLECRANLLDSFPILNDTITYLYIDYNNITNISRLPMYLEYFSCCGNSLDSLPQLNNNLISISCSYCNLNTFPLMSLNLSTVDCSHNNLTNIPNTTRNLWYLDCSNNPTLSCLPYLTSNLTQLTFDSTNIECVNNVYSTTYYYPTIPPICLPYLHSCPSYVSVSGKLFNDIDFDCNHDTIESGFANVTVYVDVAGSGTAIYSTDDNGNYASDTMGTGLFIIHPDTLDLPFNIICPVSGYDTIIVDSTTPAYTDRNFALQCKPGFDIGTSGLVNSSVILRPATPANFELHAGDMADLYGVHCANIAGKITVNYTGHIRYNGASVGSLLPDSILPNHLVWNITDFSTLDFYDDIKPIFFVDSSAVAGDVVCFTTEVTPSIGDRIPSNNIINQCFNVVASYDPNIKEVSPSGSVTSSQDWLYYTIHFQNTGTSYAENIYVWDTIDANLDINTIQALGASHDQFMQVFPTSRAVRFNFLQINLLDSTTNEPESHGWVKYRIKLNDSLSEGTNIHNTASIYFDLNAPVVTNTITTNICNTPSNVSQSYTIASGQSIIVGSSIYTQSGHYTNILSNNNGCDSIVNTTLQVVSGIGENNSIRMLMYPNPANNQVMIQIEGNPNNQLQIIDMYGSEVYNSEIKSNRFVVNTESFTAGTYIVKYGTYHQKLIVNH